LKKPRRSSAAAIAKGRLRALRERGITIDEQGRARKRGAFLPLAALKRAIAASSKKKRPAPRKPARKPARKPPKKPARKPPKKPTRKPTRKPPAAAPAPSIEEALPALTRKEHEAIKAAVPPEARASMVAALSAMKPEARRTVIETLLKEREGVKPTKKEEKAAARLKRLAEEARKAKEEKKRLQAAKNELQRAVRVATKNPKRAYGYDPKVKSHYNIRGAFAGYKWLPFDRRAGHVQEKLKEKFPRDYVRDLHTQAVHLRKYMAQGDGGAGRRAIVEKTLLAGRRCIDERLVNKKTGKPLRIYQMYIARIRILVRSQDAEAHRGYTTYPIEGKKSKAVTIIRGLAGFEQVRPGETPKMTLDRLVERLEEHLDDILDGLPVIYVKSLEIKFDTEPQ
jgi:hypothetical protein